MISTKEKNNTKKGTKDTKHNSNRYLVSPSLFFFSSFFIHILSLTLSRSHSLPTDHLNNIDKRLSDQDDRITRLYTLHGKMLEKLDKIDQTQHENSQELKGNNASRIIADRMTQIVVGWLDRFERCCCSSRQISNHSRSECKLFFHPLPTISNNSSLMVVVCREKQEVGRFDDSFEL